MVADGNGGRVRGSPAATPPAAAAHLAASFHGADYMQSTCSPEAVAAVLRPPRRLPQLLRVDKRAAGRCLAVPAPGAPDRSSMTSAAVREQELRQLRGEACDSDGRCCKTGLRQH